MSTTPTISGVVTDGRGDPVPFATVWVYRAETPDVVGRATSRIDGSYDVTVPPHTYDIVAGKVGYDVTGRRDVTVEPGSSATADLSLSAGVGGRRAADSGDATGLPGSGGGSRSSLSSRERKSAIEPVDPRDVLAGVRSLEVTRWEYDDRPGVTHMGPMAEEFRETFGLGADRERITAVDADGVAFAAIQGLSRRLDEREGRIDELTGTVEDREERIAELETEIERKDARIGDQADRIAKLERRLARLEARIGPDAERATNRATDDTTTDDTTTDHTTTDHTTTDDHDD